MQEQSHRGKSADNPHSQSCRDLRDLETPALKKGNQGPYNATNQPRRRNTCQWDQELLQRSAPQYLHWLGVDLRLSLIPPQGGTFYGRLASFQEHGELRLKLQRPNCI